jgi:hypothetical protein
MSNSQEKCSICGGDMVITVSGYDSLPFAACMTCDIEQNSATPITFQTQKIPSNICFMSETGKRVTLDFSGDTLQVIGDMALDESALHLFEYIQGLYNSERHHIRELEKALNRLVEVADCVAYEKNVGIMDDAIEAARAVLTSKE